ncbi:hypothetical protein [Syntrophus aciditrophicus]|uniref:Hypothetical cytosolic protein n=1 Tax=Syntrophus aciditrophicus (strain SB) TaxID=56780 RepID=Q2LVJ3_SYNAS|nr:hypothetical protein [Syntrophus aciditrophicus]ABC78102.1 hypothetical cytosolic protein [Syntrophus aciditrophicus SB]
MFINELGIFTQSFTRFLEEQCDEEVWYDLRIKIGFINGQLEVRLDTPPLVETTFIPNDAMEEESALPDAMTWPLPADFMTESPLISADEEEDPSCEEKKIASKGQIITCTNGHEICELSRDFFKDQDVNPDLFINYRSPQQIITENNRINEIKCQLCGAQWLQGGAWNIRFFSEGQWIPE